VEPYPENISDSGHGFGVYYRN